MSEETIYEDVITELFDEIEKAQKDSQDLIRNGINGEPMTYYAMGLLKAVRIVRQEVQKSTQKPTQMQQA
ncbi:MAG: hypothetical protein J6I66_01830 [Lachnospiraceae bacterium]|nr:hypothetical protein [Lachnospiraceae bacterium]